MPGIYVGGINVPGYVDIEGSGKDVTIISGSSGYYEGILTFGTGSNDVRNLSLTGDGNAVFCQNSTLNFSDVNVESTGLAFRIYPNSIVNMSNMHIHASSTGIETVSASIVIDNVKVDADGGTASNGIYVSAAQAAVKNSDISSTGIGVNIGYASATSNNAYGVAKLFNSSVKGTANSVALGYSNNLYAAGTLIDGPILQQLPYGIVTKLINCFDGSFNAIPNQ